MSLVEVGLERTSNTWYSRIRQLCRLAVLRIVSTEGYKREHGLYRCAQLVDMLTGAITHNQMMVDQYRKWIDQYTREWESACDLLSVRTGDHMSSIIHRGNIRGIPSVINEDAVMDEYTSEDLQLIEHADALFESIEYKKKSKMTLERVSGELKSTLSRVRLGADQIILCSHMSTVNIMTSTLSPIDVSQISDAAVNDVQRIMEVTAETCNVMNVDIADVEMGLPRRRGNTKGSVFASVFRQSADAINVKYTKSGLLTKPLN